MCFGQLHSLLNDLVDDQNVSEHLKDSTEHIISNDAHFHSVVQSLQKQATSQAQQSADKDPPYLFENQPKTDFKDGQFRCRIYSMHTNMPAIHRTDGLHPDGGPLPGMLLYDTTTGFDVRKEDGQTLDIPAISKCSAGFQEMSDLLRYFKRDSLDGKGLEMVASVYVGANMNNAYWCGGPDGPNMMLFGQGGFGKGMIMLELSDQKEDQERFKGLLQAREGICNRDCFYEIEVLGHEVTHGLVQFTAGLGTAMPETDPNFNNYKFESGTLNESIADCFGMMLKHKALNLKVDQSDWDMCPNALNPKFLEFQKWTKGYIRTFRQPDPKENPGRFAPKTMDKFRHNTEDPHVYSGIPSHAFYLAALKFGGYSWTTVGKIWYAALTDGEFKKASNHTLKYWAGLTTSHAKKIFDTGGENILKQAWVEVGVYKPVPDAS